MGAAAASQHRTAGNGVPGDEDVMRVADGWMWSVGFCAKPPGTGGEPGSRMPCSDPNMEPACRLLASWALTLKELRCEHAEP